MESQARRRLNGVGERWKNLRKMRMMIQLHQISRKITCLVVLL